MEAKHILNEFSTAVADLVGEVSLSVVGVEGGRSRRTGVIIDTVHVLSVARQAEEGERIEITLSDGSIVGATVEGYDAHSELVLLKADRELPGTGLSMREGAVRVGELAITVAQPSPEGTEVATGVVRCVAGSGREGYLQTDSLLFPGFAGAPVVDADGRLLGITALALNQERSYIIPAPEALGKAKTMKDGGSPKTGYLGVRTIPVDTPREASGETGAALTGGLLVAGIEEASPAAEAGFLVGDIILSLAGRPTTDHQDLFTTLAALPAEGEIEAVVIRAGKKEVLSVRPGTRKESVTRRWRQSGHGWSR